MLNFTNSAITKQEFIDLLDEAIQYLEELNVMLDKVESDFLLKAA